MDNESTLENNSLRLESGSSEFVLIPQATASQQDGDETGTIDLGNVLEILRRRKRLALGILVTTVGLGAALSIYQTVITPRYQGTFSLLMGDPIKSGIERASSDSELKEIALQPRSPRIEVTQDLIDVLKSPLLLQQVSKKVGIREENIASNLTIERRSGDSSTVLDVILDWRNPKEGKQILDILMSSYLDFGLDQRRESIAQSINYLDEQAPALQEKVAELQVQLSKYRSKNSVIDPATAGDALIKRIQSLEDLRNELLRKKVDLKSFDSLVRSGNLSIQQSKGGIGQSDGSSKDTGVANAVVQSSAVDQLQGELSGLEKDMALAEATYKSSNPIVQQLRAQIQKLKPRLQQRQIEAVNSSLMQVNGELAEIQRQQAELQGMFNRNPSLIQQYESLQQRLEVAKANLTAYIKAREDLRLVVAQRTDPWKVIAPPEFSTRPMNANIGRILLFSLVLGASAGVGGALLADKLDKVFHNAKDVRLALGLPLLGSMQYLAKGYGPAEGETVALVGAEDNDNLHQSLRDVYANLRLLRTDRQIRLIAIASSVEEEGRTTLTALFAQVLADLGQRVLLVDADLRKPMLHKYFGVSNNSGFSTLLAEQNSAPQQFIKKVRDLLYILTAGPVPEDPTKLLSSEQCRISLQQIKSLDEYDYVLFDTSPAIELTDTLLLSEHLDGILFVVSLNHVHRDLSSQALMRLKASRASVLGVVSNEVNEPSDGLGDVDFSLNKSILPSLASKA
jgi:succinoglycan biosynthesis transport protein ExoP